MITIIDYGMGNLRSVQKAFERIRVPAKISSDIKEILISDKKGSQLCAQQWLNLNCWCRQWGEYSWQ